MEEKIQIVVVDDSQTIRKSLRIYSKAKKWRFVDCDGASLPINVQEDLPTLVLLDYYLAGVKPEIWLKEFKDKYQNLQHVVYVLSGNYSKDEVIQFANKHKLAGVLGKPLDPRRLPELVKNAQKDFNVVLKLPSEIDKQAILQKIVEERDVVMRILDMPTLQPVYENRKAREHPLGKIGYQNVQILVRQLANSTESRVLHLEWNASENCWFRRRLSQVGSWYWLEELKTQTDPKLDQNLAVLFRTQDKKKQLEILADILEREWGITRVRCHRVCQLYKLSQYLVQPLWQKGNGFSISIKNWKKRHFLLDDNDAAKEAFQTKNPYSTCLVTDKVTDDSCPNNYDVIWGNAKECVKMPIWDDNVEKACASPFEMNGKSPLGILCIDCRTDHLESANAWIQDSTNKNEITAKEMRHIGELLKAVRPMLKSYIRDYRSDWEHKWEKQLGKIVKKALQRDEAKSALGYTLLQISKKWQAHNQKPRDIYLILLREDNLLQSWVGMGEIFEKRKGQLFELEMPFKEALQETYVIHDFQKQVKEWLLQDKSRQRLNEVFGPKQLALKEVGSWLGIPLKQGARTFGILVITIEENFCFTNAMVQSLEKTAERIMPILLWGFSHAKREWLVRALAHEYREPVNRLMNLAEKLPSKEREEAKALLDYQSSIVVNLRILAGTSDISKHQGDTLLYNVCTDVIKVLRSSYNNVKIEHLEKDNGLSVPIPRAVMYQILFNLIENACKFSLPDKPVQTHSEIVDEQLLINICNHCAEPIPEHDKKRIFLPFERGSEAPSAKGAGIGLAVVRQLANKFHLDLKLEQNENVPVICFTLIFPKGK